MQFDSVSAFFAMGGHALYVWLAYGATLAVLIGNVLVVRRARKRQLARLRWQAAAASEDAAGMEDVKEVKGSSD